MLASVIRGKKFPYYTGHSLLYIMPNSYLGILDQGWVSRYERKITKIYISANRACVELDYGI